MKCLLNLYNFSILYRDFHFCTILLWLSFSDRSVLVYYFFPVGLNPLNKAAKLIITIKLQINTHNSIVKPYFIVSL